MYPIKAIEGWIGVVRMRSHLHRKTRGSDLVTAASDRVAEKPHSDSVSLQEGPEDVCPAKAKLLQDLIAHYRGSYKVLHRQAWKIVGSPEIADDVVQDAFANTAAAILKGAEIENMAGWLCRCVRNGSVGYAENKNSSTKPLEVGSDTVDHDSSPYHEYARRTWNSDVCRAAEGLRPNQKKAFILGDIRGLKYSEIAESMGCSENLVRQLISRARKQIRAVIGSDNVPLVPPLLWQLGNNDSISPKSHAHALRETITAKLSNIETSVLNFTHRSVEAISQPTAALIIGTVVVIAVGASGATDKTSRQIDPDSAHVVAVVSGQTQSKKLSVHKLRGRKVPGRTSNLTTAGQRYKVPSSYRSIKHRPPPESTHRDSRSNDSDPSIRRSRHPDATAAIASEPATAIGGEVTGSCIDRSDSICNDELRSYEGEVHAESVNSLPVESGSDCTLAGSDKLCEGSGSYDMSSDGTDPRRPEKEPAGRAGDLSLP